ncbi:hypothetical protein [Streptomyces sp. FIT100]|uniref:hypothetical protein n=1 Tax=Streptomyces sp. FIT100 TaxID=2837956 RepID=UPI0021C93D42|nr:hypothetical protein [Streptomyces sp. FIT100]UUN30030.1 hypothetical protein KK483_29430 [Streptomyces sp. FIT100]
MTATAWMDSLWDPGARLLRAPASLAPHTHMVRETIWYAVGLLTRAGTSDRARAVEAVERVLAHQFTLPGHVGHGTWRRWPDEQDPAPDAAEWRDYDPNWREFIGTALLLVLHEFEPDLPAALVARIDDALTLATAGSRQRGVSAHYTNIALMAAYLYDAVGDRHGRAELRGAGELLATEVHTVWARTGAFPEFNSPTYYGVDLFGLALWRGLAPSPVLRGLGAVMERRLWEEIAARYHPDLRNIAGPYDRTYGMDLQRYVSLLGLWIQLATRGAQAPLPAGGPGAADHAHDWCFAPCFALLASTPPADVTARLTAFSGRRHVATTVTTAPRRVATSWIGERHLIGAQDAGGSHDEWDDQSCPVAVHWRAPGTSHGVHWLRAAPGTPVDATVDREGTLRLTHYARRNPGRPLRFVAYAPRSAPDDVTAGHWRLPGLTVRVESAAGIDAVTAHSDGLLHITYAPVDAPHEGGTEFLLRFTPA